MLQNTNFIGMKNAIVPTEKVQTISPVCVCVCVKTHDMVVKEKSN